MSEEVFDNDTQPSFTPRPAFHVYDPTPLDGYNTNIKINDEMRQLLCQVLQETELGVDEKAIFALMKQLGRVPTLRAQKKRELADRAIARSQEREIAAAV